MTWQADLERMGERGRGHVTPPGLSVYVRVTERVLGGVVRPTLDIGNVGAEHQGMGAFSRWLPEFESLAAKRGRAVFVENVMTPRFAAFWSRRGYRIIDAEEGCINFWLPCPLQ